MPPTTAKQLYTARSQFWYGDQLFRPVEQGGRPLEAGDPLLQKLKHMFVPYTPQVRDYPGRKTPHGD